MTKAMMVCSGINAALEVRVATVAAAHGLLRGKNSRPYFFPISTTRGISCCCEVSASNFLKEFFETRRSMGDQQATRHTGDTAIAMRHIAWRKNRRALRGRKLLFSAGKFIFAFNNLDSLVLAMMNVRWRPSAGLVEGFRHAQDAASV